MAKFNNDLKNGNKYEKFIVDIMKNYGFEIKNYSDGDDIIERKRYDMTLTKGSKDYLFEVKSDILSYETGNEIFEYFCNKKPSGIFTTESDFFVIVGELRDRVFIYKTKELKEAIMDCVKGTDKYDYFKKSGMGDFGNSICILMTTESAIRDLKPLVIDIKVPIYDVDGALNHMKENKSDYRKVINKLTELKYGLQKI